MYIAVVGVNNWAKEHNDALTRHLEMPVYCVNQAHKLLLRSFVSGSIVFDHVAACADLPYRRSIELERQGGHSKSVRVLEVCATGNEIYQTRSRYFGQPVSPLYP